MSADSSNPLAAEPLNARTRAVQENLSGIRHRPSVVVLAATQPPALHPHVTAALVEAAGGRPALDEADVVNTWDDVVWVQPEMLVLALPGRTLDEIVAEFTAIADMPVWRDLPATYLNQIYAAILSSQSSDVVELLAGLLHPDRCTPPPAAQARRISTLVRTDLRD
jgi:hypothetical protein